MIMLPEGIWKVICTKGPQGSRGVIFLAVPNIDRPIFTRASLSASPIMMTVRVSLNTARATMPSRSLICESRVTSGSSQTTGGGTTARSSTLGTGVWNYDRVRDAFDLDRFYDRWNCCV